MTDQELAADRVRAFLDARAEMNGIDHEVILAVWVAGEQHRLLASDLRLLVGP